MFTDSRNQRPMDFKSSFQGCPRPSHGPQLRSFKKLIASDAETKEFKTGPFYILCRCSCTFLEHFVKAREVEAEMTVMYISPLYLSLSQGHKEPQVGFVS